METTTASDELNILRLISRIALAIDDRDEAAYADCFAPMLEQWRDGQEGWQAISAEEYANASVTSVLPLDWTHHQVFNPVVEVNGDTAEAVTDIVVQIHFRGETTTIGGRYALSFGRLEQGWRVTRRRRTTRYVLGNPALAAQASAAHSKATELPVR
nr:nuclear transport factor 2 family protein [Sphingomonas sp. CDS-1]